MKKLFLLAGANIRKHKGHSVSLGLLFLIAALLLNVGLLVTLHFGSFFTNLASDINMADVYYMVPEALYTQEAFDYVAGHKSVTEVQEESALVLSASISYGDREREVSFVARDANKERKMSQWKAVGNTEPLGKGDVYLPYVFRLDGHYNIGDELNFTIDGEKFNYTVRGFIDDGFYSSLDTGPLALYMNGDTYEDMSNRLVPEQFAMRILFAKVTEFDGKIESGLREVLGISSASLIGDASNMMISIDRTLIEMSRTMMANMIAVMMVIFAVVIVVVCLIVVRFRIGISIEDDIMKFGSLKAVGYTSSQIIGSVVLQFALIACVGSLAGVGLSYPLLPAISNVFAQQSGLRWEQGFDGIISGSVLVFVLLVVVGIALMTARKVKRLSPIQALRGGTDGKKPVKTRVALSKTRGPLPVVLALKSTVQNIKQNIMIAVIVTAVAFAGVFAIIMFYNSTVNTDTFAEVPGIERSSALVVFSPRTDNDAIVAELGARPEVDRITYVDEVKLKIDGSEITTYIMEDFDTRATNTVYEGRYPRVEGEITLAGVLSDRLGKTIGDTVEVGFAGKMQTMKVVGLSQGANMGGLNAAILLGDMLDLNPDFVQTNLNLYLKDGEDAAAFVKSLDGKYPKDQVVAVADMVKGFDEGMGIYTSIVSLVGIVILIVTFLVVVLVLYFVINAAVSRRKRELGIQKAIGYTTTQLMHQVSLGFLPSILLGIAVGCALGVLYTNPVMSVAMGAMGIMKANFIVQPLWIVLFGIGVLILAYATALLITRKIKKISAYKLVTE